MIFNNDLLRPYKVNSIAWSVLLDLSQLLLSNIETGVSVIRLQSLIILCQGQLIQLDKDLSLTDLNSFYVNAKRSY